jgi:predicted nucleic acid-binding protein
MILVDTCGWIEWLVEGALVDNFAPFMRDPKEILMPTIVQYELYKWIKRETDEITANDTMGLSGDCLCVPLSTEIALMAADLAIKHKLALADAVIYASARKHHVEVVTADDHFKGLPGVVYFAKNK